jgi:hypothetical protein
MKASTESRGSGDGHTHFGFSLGHSHGATAVTQTTEFPRAGTLAWARTMSPAPIAERFARAINPTLPLGPQNTGLSCGAPLHCRTGAGRRQFQSLVLHQGCLIWPRG